MVNQTGDVCYGQRGGGVKWFSGKRPLGSARLNTAHPPPPPHTPSFSASSPRDDAPNSSDRRALGHRVTVAWLISRTLRDDLMEEN